MSASLIKILAQLPSGPVHLLSLRLVSKRFSHLAESPALWARTFHDTPYFTLIPELRQDRIQATRTPPEGSWNGYKWISRDQTSTEDPIISSRKIPIHYPTLYRSRQNLKRLLHSSSKEYEPDTQVLEGHTGPVYCLCFSYPYLLTGSRDRTIRIWYFDPIDGQAREVKVIKDAHDGSVLAIKMDGEMIVTGSSDMTARVWHFGLELKDGNLQGEMERKKTLRGHTASVLDVALTKSRIATW
jgi:F-box and WD-40 domain protein 1/11